MDKLNIFFTNIDTSQFGDDLAIVVDDNANELVVAYNLPINYNPAGDEVYEFIPYFNELAAKLKSVISVKHKIMINCCHYIDDSYWIVNEYNEETIQSYKRLVTGTVFQKEWEDGQFYPHRTGYNFDTKSFFDYVTTVSEDEKNELPF